MTRPDPDSSQGLPPQGPPSQGLPIASALLIADGFSAPHATLAMLRAARIAVAGPVSYREAIDRLEAASAFDLILIEAQESEAAALEADLPAMAARMLASDAAIIALFDAALIDLVAAHLPPGRAQLLCEPSDGERMAAISVALARSSGGVREQGADSESERLQRLNEEAARIAEALARLTNSAPPQTPSPFLEDRVSGYRAGSDDPLPIAASEVRQAIRLRRMRDQLFGAGLFEDPAWDMLLDLFAAELERSRVSVSSLCIAAAVAPTTALRWIGRMTESGLLLREPDPFDRRRAFMALAPDTRAAMHEYCAAVKRAGGAIA